MAVVRTKTSGNLGAIIFLVFLVVVAAAIAIFFYMKVEKLELGRRQADAKVNNLGSKLDVDAFIQPAHFGEKPNKPLREAINEVDAMRSKIDAGDPANNRDVPTSALLTDPDGLISAKLNSIDEKFAKLQLPATKHLSLFSGIDDLMAQLDKMNDRAKAAETQLAAAQTTNTDERTHYENERDAWRKSLAQVQVDKDQLTKQVQDEEKAHKDDIAKYEADKDTQVKTQADVERTAAVKIKKLEDEITRLNGRITQLQVQISQFKPKNPVDLSNEPDGRIIRVDKDSDVAYVNIGSAERATRGLTFAVYDPKYNINTVTADGQSHEKAFLELIEVGEHETMARITHTNKDQPVVVGDVIANPVYHLDKTRKFHFFVYGEFDIDGDGVPTPAERDQLIRLIQNWGGIVDDQFTTQTDFLILGGIPGSSTHVFETGTDEDKARDQKRAEDQKYYADLVGKAHDWSIPVLNTNRFLTMIGYFNTSTVQRPLFRPEPQKRPTE